MGLQRLPVKPATLLFSWEDLRNETNEDYTYKFGIKLFILSMLYSG